MKKTDEYAQNANDCRKLAKQMAVGEQQEQLFKMAETWEVLAAERERTLRNRVEMDAVAPAVGKLKAD